MNPTRLFTILVTAFVVTSFVGCLEIPVKKNSNSFSEQTDEDVWQEEGQDTTPEETLTEVEEIGTTDAEVDPLICDKVSDIFGAWHLFHDSKWYEDIKAQISGTPQALTCLVHYELDWPKDYVGDLEAKNLPMVHNLSGGGFLKFIIITPFEMNIEEHDEAGDLQEIFTYVR